MKQLATFFACTALILQACGQNNAGNSPKVDKPKPEKTEIPKPSISYKLSDFLSENEQLDKDVEALFSSLDDTATVAQLIMPAAGINGFDPLLVKKYIKNRQIGGVLLLKGTQAQFTSWIKDFKKLNEQNGDPKFLFSSDAEPTLFNMKIKGTPIVKKASDITSIAEVVKCADTIAFTLNKIGINYNFAPVVDLSQNATVGYRGFGKNPTNNVPWSLAFIQVMQKNGIIATAKHFPGHGLVSGDTHKSLQTIDGELKEVPTYPGLIKDSVLSVMIGHLAVMNNPKYNTDGLPATCSKVIVTDLLRNELGFKGLVVTDAMNMGGVTAVANSATKAVEAGCDIILMPLDAGKTHSELLAKYRKDPAFKKIVDAAAKRILRMKLCVK